MGESKKDALVRVSQFIVRKESEAVAKDCHDWLVKTVLFNSDNKGLSVPEIIDEIDEQMGLKEFPASTIQDSVRRLCVEKLELRKESGKYFLENEEYAKIKEIMSERRKALDYIESTVKAKLEEKLGEPEVDANTLNLALEVIYGFLVRWFSSESSFAANLLFLEKKVAVLDSAIQILNTSLKKVKDKDIKQAIRTSILEIFEAPEELLAKFLYEVLQNYLHLELFNLDPECRILQKVAFAGKTLILDTNILMALFLKSDTKHEGTAELISISQKLGINLVFTKRTKREWRNALEDANEEFLTISSARHSLLRDLEDVFIVSYLREKTASPSFTWQGFYLQMRQIDRLAKARGIEFWDRKEISLDKLPNKEFYEPMSGRVYYCAKKVGNPKGKQVCLHDAYHLLLVRKIRENQAGDMLGPSCWFLTHDSSLLCADEGLNEFTKDPLAPPSSFLADMWITVIAPFLGPEISWSTLVEAFTHLMKTHFATMPSGLNAEKVVEVLGHWLPYKTLSDADLEAILGDAVVTKYYDELRAARVKDPRKVKALKEKLREEVDKKVYGIFDEKVASAQLERDEAKKLALEKERELLAEKRHRKLILRICGVLGSIFAFFGLFFSATGNLTTGVVLVMPGIVFIILALTFRYVKVKAGPFEIEAKQ